MREIYCDECDLYFKGEVWDDGWCPQCNRGYYWEEFKTEDDWWPEYYWDDYKKDID